MLARGYPPEQVAAPEVPEVEVAQDAAPDGGRVDGQNLQGDHQQHQACSKVALSLQQHSKPLSWADELSDGHDKLLEGCGWPCWMP